MDEARAHFWLIPDGAPLLAGSFAIADVLGGRRLVDAAALAPFAVTSDQADARARARLEALADAFKHTLAELLQPSAAPALGLIAAGARAVEHEVEAAGARLRSVLGGAKRAIHTLAEDLRLAAPAPALAPAPPDELEQVLRAVMSKLIEFAAGLHGAAANPRG